MNTLMFLASFIPACMVIRYGIKGDREMMWLSVFVWFIATAVGVAITYFPAGPPTAAN